MAAPDVSPQPEFERRVGVVAASQGQGSVNNFCSALNTAVSDASSIQSWLNAAGVASDLVSAIASAGDPISIAQCACDLEQGVGQISSEASSCFQDAICGLQQDLGWGRWQVHAAASGRRGVQRDRRRQRQPRHDAS